MSIAFGRLLRASASADWVLGGPTRGRATGLEWPSWPYTFDPKVYSRPEAVKTAE